MKEGQEGASIVREWEYTAKDIDRLFLRRERKENIERFFNIKTNHD